MSTTAEKREQRKARKEAKKKGLALDEVVPESNIKKRDPMEERDDFIEEARTGIEQFSVSQAGGTEASGSQLDQDDVVKINNFSISVGGKELFRNASLTVSKGRRYGLLGPNGQGKTTLLKHMAERKMRGISENISILLVEQELAVPDDTRVVDAVLRADKKTRALLEEEQKLQQKQEEGDVSEETGNKLREIYDELHFRGADSAESRVRRILYGLGFDDSAQERPTRTFSGGWRMRVSLAQALFMEPDLLLLDEPTNHLDLNAVIWLDSYLQKWKKMLLVVSHDQDFLDSICTDIIHLENKQLVQYRGGYYEFKKMHAQREKDLARQYEKQQDKLKQFKKQGLSKDKAEAAAKKQAATKKEKGAGKKKGGEDEESMLTKLQAELIERPKEYKVHFDFPTPPEITPPYIEVDNVSFRYNETKPWLFTELDFGVGLDTRACVVGPNGSGKSTVIKLLAGEVTPSQGEVRINRKLRVARYHQHFDDLLPFEKTPVDYLKDKFNKTYQEVRNKLGKFGLEGHAHTILIRDLSGGQKARVVLADISFQEPHIMYLDEPTNHLDIESIDALIHGINEFEGGVVCVTHDARLVKEAEMVLWVVENQDCAAYDGTFDDYRMRILRQIEDYGNPNINRES
eukprot:comp23842_c0_seq1/m.41634 comp23842_c0_seq1/g.41634  ORF comp23842_c0_seq1/g.41634 comp23842_c0_seq1/m.41634 type:complete len:632 (-) comp23842_c0_seq1:229-2124(-)